jgi:hypothetical protein
MKERKKPTNKRELWLLIDDGRGVSVELYSRGPMKFTSAGEHSIISG